MNAAMSSINDNGRFFVPVANLALMLTTTLSCCRSEQCRTEREFERKKRIDSA